MTEEYKKILLDYFTGNATIETPGKEVNFNTTETGSSVLHDSLYEMFPNGVDIKGNIQSKDSKGNSSNINIIYGGYRKTAGSPINGGYILLIDKSGNNVQLITKYASGTDLSPILALNVDEIGQLYGIDDFNGVRRFIMLNNISILLPDQEERKCVLRQSYNLPDEIKNKAKYAVEKSAGSSNYLIVSNDNLTFTNLEVVVGASNNWTHYEYNNYFDFSDIYGSWSENEFIFKASNNSDDRYTEITVDNLTLTPIKKDYLYKITNPGDYIVDFGRVEADAQMQSLILNTDTAYCKVRATKIDDFANYYFIIFKINYSTNEAVEIKKIVVDRGSTSTVSSFEKNKELVLLYIQSSYTIYSGYSIAIIYDTEVYEGSYLSVAPLGNAKLITNVEFNIVTITLRSDSFSGYSIISGYAIYNHNIYTKEPYINLESLVPSYMSLKTESDGILDYVDIFSRELYNKVISNNKTISTILIPNSMCNDKEINRLSVFGNTNIQFNNYNEQFDSFSKNIYEEVFLNFETEINIKKDDTIEEFYNLGASRLNGSVSNINDYENVKATKYKIYYEDDTTETKTLTYTQISNFYKAKMVFFAKKNITHIEIISEDENTVYCNIEREIASGKFYSLEADVWCNDKIQAEQIYYGNEPVFYNNEEIYY